MKRLMVLTSLLLSVTAHARERVSFSYFGNEGWGNAYYACDYVEHQTENLLKIFGATEVNVRCTGGIEQGRNWGSVSVRATFEAPVLSGRDIAEVVTYKGDVFNPACNLNVTIVKSLLPKFPNVSVTHKSDSCAFYRSNYSYVFSIQR